MSKINAVRFINLNYNNNAIRISDETFHLNGESTLLSLRNGGGKSVLVQMLTAPFVHKRYRDAKDRPFESYFTTNKPTFILVEWALDQGAGYVLTGMMVRKSQEISETSAENLEMISFISEYQESCLQDIHHLPVVEKGKKEMILKNFAACRQLFESYKKDRSVQFFYYDMNQSAQSRQYFEKLKEYQINYKEWETIIKKVNLKESGLSDLFADCRDEKGLVEKWFLEAVESKLNKERNRMKEFQSIVEKYVGQYKDNQSKIERRDTIRRFKEEAVPIMERAKEYQAASVQEKAMENQVANFIRELDGLLNTSQREEDAVKQEIAAIREEIAHTGYEMLSQEIHELRKKERFHTSNREMIGMEKEDLENESLQVEETLHILDCARAQEGLDESRRELKHVRERIEVSRQKEEDLEPERRRLGYTLKQHYQDELSARQEEEEANDALLNKTRKQIRQETEKAESLEQQIREAASALGGMKARIRIYDEKEENFRKRYGDFPVRNILGEYEPGSLDIRGDGYRQELEEQRRSRTASRKQLEFAKEKQKQVDRLLEDSRAEQIRKKAEQKQAEQTKARYDEELSVRRVVLRYLNLEEKDVFETPKILHTSQRKLKEIESIRRNLEKEEDELQKEYIRLTQGKVLELPQEFEEMLQALGIHAVFGMEWLNKNGYPAKKNQMLIHRHPFLPYALLLSGQELKKLSGHEKEIYTSFPIPIMVREHLEQEAEIGNSSVVTLSGVSFYVLFNENLLDENKLRILVGEQEIQIRKKKEAIETRRSEYREYFERKELVKNQSVSGERYEDLLAFLEDTEQEIQKLDAEIIRQTQEQAELRSLRESLDAKIRMADQEIERQERRLEDFQELCRSYLSYLEEQRAFQKCEQEIIRLESLKQLSKNCCDKLIEQQKSLEVRKDSLQRRKEEIKERLHRYQDCEVTPIQEGEIEELEARYLAITSGMSREMQELEEQLRMAGKRFEKAAEELTYLRDKYRLEDGAWDCVVYSRKEESHQEILLEDKRRKIHEKQRQWNDEDKKTAVIETQLKERMEKMRRECNKDQPLPKEAIQTQDFEAKKNHLEYRAREEDKKAEAISKVIRSYEENLTALSEYSEFIITEPVEWEQDFREMTSRELRSFKGILIRDYNQSQRQIREGRASLEQILNRTVRMELFQEDFYRKPLESMLELTYDASQAIGQLTITIQSYDSLMEKLEIDISLVEKEKDKIVELLEEYIKEVHQNLGKIDHNSTITIRDRSIKMLKLQLPDWEENEALYKIRLQDMIDEITRKGIEIFGENVNAQEYFGTRMTTRNLYDSVIGIGNVQIRLYKIEEQREYPITWTEVAKNSGGEGFLSAFIILSSLLYYMRKDDSDLFADRNEGKVLVMDNPFAQTNASHLLKPLMDMAKKTNTQLICLSGLGGESIYNRFDNIYVLNLIAASLRNGMQYLKANHMRGTEAEVMLLSRVQVIEQQELIF